MIGGRDEAVRKEIKVDHVFEKNVLEHIGEVVEGIDAKEGRSEAPGNKGGYQVAGVDDGCEPEPQLQEDADNLR